MKDWIDLTSAEIATQALREYRSAPTSGSALRLIEALASRVLQLEERVEVQRKQRLKAERADCEVKEGER